MKIYPVLLAGGSGTRLWPLSRPLFPKQFLSLFGEHRLLQETALRLDSVSQAEWDVASPIVVCNQGHRFLVQEQLEAVGKKPLRMIVEPQGRNTAPALTLAAYFISRFLEDGDPLLLVMPVDHRIKDVAAFRNAVEAGITAAEQGYLITFGVVPTTAETG